MSWFEEMSYGGYIQEVIFFRLFVDFGDTCCREEKYCVGDFLNAFLNIVINAVTES